jgi:hypothetical protein
MKRAYNLAWFALFGALVLLFVVEIHQATTNQASYYAQRRNQAAERKSDDVFSVEKADDRIAKYTFWLALLTGGLVVVSAVQIFFLIRADQTARIMAETAQAQTAKMGDWANSAQKQMLIVGRQTDIQEKQHAIGRLQFLATHRPRIVVRGVSLDEEGGLSTGRRLKIQIPFTNQGNTDAQVRQFAARTFLVPRIDQINVGNEFHIIDTSGMAPLTSGTHAIVGILTEMTFSGADILQLRQGSAFLLCVGYVQYGDDSGGLRATGFARCLQPESSRFTPISDPEYEFSY